MRHIALLVVFGAWASSLCAAPPDAVIIAAMRLAEQDSYSWTTTVEDDARTYEVRGQTQRGGYTRVQMPLVNAVRRRLGASFGDTQAELIFKGNVRCVFATDTGWKTLAELPPPAPEASVAVPVSLPAPGPGGAAGLPPLPRRDESKRPPYSNLQLAISHPHEELAVIVANQANLELAGDTAIGTLNTLGAQLLLVHDGQEQITPYASRGTFKLWFRDGQVVRYQLKLEGWLEVATATGPLTVFVRQNSETTLREVGRTRFEVPEEARLKLN